MKLIDTHTHLYSDAFAEDRNEMIERAISDGVDKFYIPAIDSQTTQAMYDLEQAFPDRMYLMMGLHPTSVKENYEEELSHVEEELAKRKFYAIGEIGIDLYWDQSTLEIQQDAFRRQIKLAKKYKLPIVIHCRNAFDEVFEILEEEKGDDLFGIFHCFTGTLAQAKQALQYNMKLGIGGVVTFKNGKIDKFLNEIDLKHIVIETDAPYLAPKPFRGKRNESAYVVKVAEKLAEVYDTSVEEIAEITTENALEIFQIH
ncbi:TatD family hydrolase [Mesonia mobilis]|uniref:TatD family hydrolase n=1 Tax=Mesonia mobilis TaxID=369791 RepID=A0ABQ3BGQ6_9FLAO|nr:TatD family hydrolase [Mesonia mobilis]MBQ0739437.1 TatD family hydrolase [Aquimarina celericrescens]GGZ44676.1 TatD family hydrolase [Mesonia mobilis]